MTRSQLVCTGLLFMCYNFSPAQKTALSFSLFSHATSLPGGTWAGAWHPGFDVGVQTHVRQKEKSLTYLHWKFGYYYHRLVHHGVQLYGEYNWDISVYKKLGAGVAGGLGYLHTLEDHEIFKLNDQGSYQKTGKLGKAHAQISVSTNLNYHLSNGWQPFLQYRFRLVTPFVNKYVPLLPATSVHAGVFIPLIPTSSE